MDGFGKNPTEIKNITEHLSGRKISKYRWLIVMLLIPLFFAAGTDYVGVRTFTYLFLGTILYNLAVNFYLAKEYGRVGKIPGYIFYIDIILVSLLVFLFGGRQSDIYLLYFFIIASYATSETMSKTIKFSMGISVVYTLSCAIYGQMHDPRWAMGSQLIDVFIRDLNLIIVSYAIALVIEEVKKTDNLHKIEYMKARTDKLTGLPNRHYMEQRLAAEIADCNMHQKVMNVLVFDIDNFKKFNDTYGHVWGDELLKRFADIIKQSIRNTDIPIRYGGEEFVVLIKDIEFATAKGVGDRVRRGLEKEKIFIEEGGVQKRVTVSCGIAQYPNHATDISEVIKLADKALYCAKETGKNTVVGYDELLLVEHLMEIEEKATGKK